MTSIGDKTRIAVVLSMASNEALLELIHATQDLEIVGCVQGTQAGIELVREQTPAIVLVESCSELVEFTHQCKSISNSIGIIILGKRNDLAHYVVNALAMGAFDVIPDLDSSLTVSNLLLSKIRCCSIKQYSRMAQIGKTQDVIATEQLKATVQEIIPFPNRQRRISKYEAILIGVSTGGPEALMELLPMIPESCPVPILIVLHMPKEFTVAMAETLDRKCQIRVSEATEGEIPVAGRAYLAPGGRHCSLERDSTHHLQLRLSDGPSENGCKPAVDVLFRSAAQTLSERAVALILTGMGSDGTIGAGILKNKGAKILVQDEHSSIVWGMPGSVVRAGFADEIHPITLLANRVCELVGGT